MQQFWEFIEIGAVFCFRPIMCLNLLFAVTIVFFERKSPKSVWAWLLLLFFMPGLGFAFYLLLGTDMRKRKMFREKELEDNLFRTIRYQEHALKNADDEVMGNGFSKYTDLVLYNMKTAGAIFTDDNDLDIFVDGNILFERMLEDMRKAEQFIYMQSYILRDDVLMERIVQVLKEKAAQGVKVRILYDAM